MHAQDLVKRKKPGDAKESPIRPLDVLKGGPALYSPLRALTLCSLRGLDEKAFPKAALWLACEEGKWSVAWVRRYGTARLEKERMFSAKRELPSLGPDGPVRFAIVSKNNAATASVNGETVFENYDLSEAFYDDLRTGRAPYLLGSRVAVTTLKARSLDFAAQADM
jgi:hypothetical protein